MTFVVESSKDIDPRRLRLSALADSDGSQTRSLFYANLDKERQRLEELHASASPNDNEESEETSDEGDVGEIFSNDPALGFRFTKSYYTVDHFGERTSERLYGLSPSLRVVEYGAVPGNIVVANVPIPCGVVLIVGPSNSAKTPLAIALGSSRDSYVHIRHGEPLAGYSLSESQLMEDLARAVFEDRTSAVIVLDSLKNEMITVPGGAMTSGLSRGIWPMLSDLSCIFSEVGKSLIIPLNPATITEGVLEMVVESAKSNVAMVIASEGENSWVTTTRRGEGLPRVNGKFKTAFKPDEGGLIFEEGSSSVSGRTNKKGQNKFATQGAISDVDFDMVLRRNFNHMRNN